MRRALTLAITAVLLLAAPASALAASAATTSAPSARQTGTPAVKGTPVTPLGVDVQLWPEDVAGSTTLIVHAVIPTSAPLPAAVSLPLPEGATVTWAGEIFQTDGQDVPRQPDISADKHILTITTVKSREVQYEAQYKPYTQRGGRRYVTLDWVQTTPAGSVLFAFRLPPLTADAKSTPAFEGDPQVNGSGEKLYTIPPSKLAVGKSVKVTVDYASQLTDLTTKSGQGPDYVMIALVSVLGIVLVALGVVVARSRRSV